MTTNEPLPGLVLRVSGRWAHFKKPETNNNPLTHDFITKTALFGLMGAVLGIERRAMRPLFPEWSDDFVYGVQVNRAVQKESWSFTLREVANIQNKAPKPMELLKEPDFTVAMALLNKRSAAVLTAFAEAIREQRSCYAPILGLHNCAAELQWVNEASYSLHQGPYQTRGFAKRSHGLDPSTIDFNKFRVGFERIPTHQDGEGWNRPDRYIEVVYPSAGFALSMRDGDFYQGSDGAAWSLV